jgi:hypothetical protein
MTDHREATLDDLLNEPIIMKVMASDGVRGSDIRQLLEQVRDRRERKLIELASEASRAQASAGRRGCQLF